MMGEWECWSLLAALAAATRRVALGPLVACTSFRNPALLAKIADTVDEVSGGRLILGLGAGWNEREYDAFGYPFDHRVSRFEEALTIVHSLLRTGQVDFAGTYYTARECELRPRGPRPAGPPIMVAGTGERMLRLAARHADAWNVWLSNRPEGLGPLRDGGRRRLRGGRARPGDAGADGRRSWSMCWGVGCGPPSTVPAPRCWRGHPRRSPPRSGPTRAQGLTRIDVWLAPNTLAGLEAFAPVLELLNHA